MNNGSSSSSSHSGGEQYINTKGATVVAISPIRESTSNIPDPPMGVLDPPVTRSTTPRIPSPRDITPIMVNGNPLDRSTVDNIPILTDSRAHRGTNVLPPVSLMYGRDVDYRHSPAPTLNSTLTLGQNVRGSALVTSRPPVMGALEAEPTGIAGNTRVASASHLATPVTTVRPDVAQTSPRVIRSPGMMVPMRPKQRESSMSPVQRIKEVSPPPPPVTFTKNPRASAVAAERREGMEQPRRSTQRQSTLPQPDARQTPSKVVSPNKGVSDRRDRDSDRDRDRRDRDVDRGRSASRHQSPERERSRPRDTPRKRDTPRRPSSRERSRERETSRKPRETPKERRPSRERSRRPSRDTHRGKNNRRDLSPLSSESDSDSDYSSPSPSPPPRKRNHRRQEKYSDYSDDDYSPRRKRRSKYDGVDISTPVRRRLDRDRPRRRNVFDYSTMSAAAQRAHRDIFNDKYSRIMEQHPNLGIALPEPDRPLEYIHEAYEIYRGYITDLAATDYSIAQWRLWMMAGWAFTEVGLKFLKLPSTGLVKANMMIMARYDAILQQMGNAGGRAIGSSWAAEWKLLLVTLVNTIVFVGVQWLARKQGLGGLGANAGEMVLGMINSTQESTMEEVSEEPVPGGGELPEAQAPTMNIGGFDLGGIAGLVNAFTGQGEGMGGIMNMLGGFLGGGVPAAGGQRAQATANPVVPLQEPQDD